MSDDQRYYGTAEPLWDFVAECLAQVQFYAGMGVDYAAAKDDPGLTYSTRRAIAALKHGVAILKMLEEKNAADLQARQLAKAEREGAAAALGL
ncbi:hypothetical protein ACRBEV_32425 [Methylobacterium phyllosphaerae]